MDFMSVVAEWFKDHIGMIMMGVAGATVTALTPSQKSIAERVVGWVVGVILCSALSTPTANYVTNGSGVEVFGFIYGMGGITLAKMITKAIEGRFKSEIEGKSGVKIDDDN